MRTPNDDDIAPGSSPSNNFHTAKRQISGRMVLEESDKGRPSPIDCTMTRNGDALMPNSIDAPNMIRKNSGLFSPVSTEFRECIFGINNPLFSPTSPVTSSSGMRTNIKSGFNLSNLKPSASFSSNAKNNTAPLETKASIDSEGASLLVLEVKNANEKNTEKEKSKEAENVPLLKFANTKMTRPQFDIGSNANGATTPATDAPLTPNKRTQNGNITPEFIGSDLQSGTPRTLHKGTPKCDIDREIIDLETEDISPPLLRTPSLPTFNPSYPQTTSSGTKADPFIIYDDEEDGNDSGVTLTSHENAAQLGYENEVSPVSSVKTAKESEISWKGVSSPAGVETSPNKDECEPENEKDETLENAEELEVEGSPSIRKSTLKIRRVFNLIVVAKEKVSGEKEERIIKIRIPMDIAYHILVHRISLCMGWEGVGTATMRLWAVHTTCWGSIAEKMMVTGENIERALQWAKESQQAGTGYFQVSLCSRTPPLGWCEAERKANEMWEEETKKAFKLPRIFGQDGGWAGEWVKPEFRWADKSAQLEFM